MKILILGFSSLEHDLVEEFDLKNLKQKEYGKIEIPLNGLLVDPSPILIWTSFITGKKPGEFGYDNVVVYNKAIKPLINLYYKTRQKNSYDNVLEKDIDKKTTDYLCKKLIKYHLARFPTKDDINCRTILDISGMIHTNIPVIDKIFDYNEKAKQAINNPSEKSVCEQEWKSDFDKQKQQVFDSLSKDSILNIHHFYILDGIQHIYFDDKLKIRTYYLYVDDFIQEVSKNLPNDVLLLVVSDAGKKNGVQTNHGFYSTNKQLGLKRPKITDFKSFIENFIQQSVSQILIGEVL